jgi:hypothetical protein
MADLKIVVFIAPLHVAKVTGRYICTVIGTKAFGPSQIGPGYLHQHDHPTTLHALNP